MIIKQHFVLNCDDLVVSGVHERHTAQATENIVHCECHLLVSLISKCQQ